MEKPPEVASITEGIASGYGRGLRSWLTYNNDNNTVAAWLATSIDAFLEQMRGASSLHEMQIAITSFFRECCEKDPERWHVYLQGLIAPVQNSLADKDSERNEMYRSLLFLARGVINEAIRVVSEQQLAEMRLGQSVQTYSEFSENRDPYATYYFGDLPPCITLEYAHQYGNAFIQGVMLCAQKNEYKHEIQEAVVSGMDIEPFHLKELMRMGNSRPMALQMLGLDEEYLKQAERAQQLIENVYADCDARSPLSTRAFGRNIGENQIPRNHAAVFTETAGEFVMAFAKLSQIFPEDAGRVHMLLSKRILTELQSRAQNTYGFDKARAEANDYLPQDAKEIVKGIAAVDAPAEFLTADEKEMSFRDRIGASKLRMSISGGNTHTELDRFERDFTREFFNELWMAMESNLKEANTVQPHETVRQFLCSTQECMEDNPAMTKRMQEILTGLLGDGSKMTEENFVDDFIEQFFVQETNENWGDIARVLTKYLPFTALQHYQSGRWYSEDIEELISIWWIDTLPYDTEDSEDGAFLQSFLAIPVEDNFLLTGIMKKRYPDVEE